jgi:3-oxoacyl-[acyl-carrier protein] reductase
MLKEKTVLVTGAVHGIGRAIVDCCLREGAHVLAVDVDAEGLVALQTSNQSQISIKNLDVADSKAIAALFSDLEYCDALVNNAGIYLGKNIFEYTDESLDRVIDVNLKGAFNFSRGFGKLVLDSKKQGAIVNIASLAGQEGSSDAAYGMTKAAIIGLTKSTAMNFAPHIRVNAVAPTIVETGMTEQVPVWRIKEYQQSALIKQPVQPLDVAETVVFLLSDRACHYTGAVFDLNNGAYFR